MPSQGKYSDRSVGFSSYRSDVSYDSDSSSSRYNKLTTREVILDMERRVDNNSLYSDHELPSLEELPARFVSWNSKIPKRLNSAEHFNNKVQINIIGCKQPVELILAKADKRLRKRNEVRKNKDIKHNERIKHINDTLEYKFGRG
jgi:hypothetical protein